MKQTRMMIILTIFCAASGMILAENNSINPAVNNFFAATGSFKICGTEMRMLPANIDVWSCDWSPSGKALVFSGKLQGEPATKLRTWYWTLDPAASPAPLTNADAFVDFSPRWSPDGAKIVLTRRALNGLNRITSAIWIKEVPGGSGKQLTTGTQDRDPVWSPDGKEIAFVRGEGPYRSQLIIANVADGKSRVVIGNKGELIQSPWWGSDGKIYFVKLLPSPKNVAVNGQTYHVMDYGIGSVWAINPNNQALEMVVEDEYDNRLPALSPDGTKLAFISNRPTKEGNGKFDRGSLYIKNLHTGQVHFVTNQVCLNGGALSWSPDGKRLAFFTFRSIRPAVWVINIP